MDKKAFTLIELLVVVLVLSILWTIAFFVFQWYSRDARDSTRVWDINNIINALNLFEADSSYYPEPSNSMEITYSWAEVWTQWTIWDDVVKKLDKLNKTPKDPLIWVEYTYSRLNTKKEFSIAWILEWTSPISYNIFTNKAYSYDRDGGYLAYLKWNYNWQMLKVQTWWITYVLGIPSIVISDFSDLDLINIINNKKLVYNSYLGLPQSYSSSIFDIGEKFDFNPNALVVFTWNINDLKTDEDKRLLLAKNLQDNYTNTIVSSSVWIRNILSTDIDLNNPSQEAKKLSSSIVRAWLWIEPTLNYE